MAFDSIDKMFNEMLKRYSALLGHDMFGNPPALKEVDADEEEDFNEFEQEEKSDGRNEKHEPDVSNRKFGYEIISGSDMKYPIIRIYGNPDEFPELKDKLEGFLKHSLGSFPDKQGLPMPGGEPDELEAPAMNAGEVSTKEPFSESFKEKDGSTTVNLDLPGVKESDVSVNVDGKALRVEAHGESHNYKKTIQLEGSATSKELHWRLNNGVLEIKIGGATP